MLLQNLSSGIFENQQWTDQIKYLARNEKNICMGFRFPKKGPNWKGSEIIGNFIKHNLLISEECS